MNVEQTRIPLLMSPQVSKVIEDLERGDLRALETSWSLLREHVDDSIRWISTYLDYAQNVYSGAGISALIDSMRKRISELRELILEVDRGLATEDLQLLREAINKLISSHDELINEYMAILIKDQEQLITPLPLWDKFLKLFPVWEEEHTSFETVPVRDLLLAWLREMADELEREETWFKEVKEAFPEVEVADEVFKLLEGLKLALGVFSTELTEGNVPEDDLKEAYRVAIEGSRGLFALKERVREVLDSLAVQMGVQLPILLLRRVVDLGPDKFPSLTGESIAWISMTRKVLSSWLSFPLISELPEDERLNSSVEILNHLLDLLLQPVISQESLEELRNLVNSDDLTQIPVLIERLRDSLTDGFGLGEPLAVPIRELGSWLLEVAAGFLPSTEGYPLIESSIRSLRTIAVLLAMKYLSEEDESYLRALDELLASYYEQRRLYEELKEEGSDPVTILKEILPLYHSALKQVKGLDLELHVQEKVICPRCGAENSITDTVCRKCGFVLGTSSRKRVVLTMNVRMPERLEEVLTLSVASLHSEEWLEEALENLDDLLANLTELEAQVNEEVSNLEEVLGELKGEERKRASENLDVLKELSRGVAPFIDKLQTLRELLEAEQRNVDALVETLASIAESWRTFAPTYFKVIEEGLRELQREEGGV